MKGEWRLWAVGGILLMFAAEMALKLTAFYRPAPVEQICAPCFRQDTGFDFYTSCGSHQPGPRLCPCCGVSWRLN